MWLSRSASAWLLLLPCVAAFQSMRLYYTSASRAASAWSLSAAERPSASNESAGLDWDSAWQEFSQKQPFPLPVEELSNGEDPKVDVVAPSSPPLPRLEGKPAELKRKFPQPNPPKPPYSRKGPGRGPRATRDTEAFQFRRQVERRRGDDPEFEVLRLFEGGTVFLLALGGVSLLLGAMIYVFITGGITDSASRFGTDIQTDIPSIVEDMTV